METLKYKIKFPEDYTYKQLLQERNLGGRFVFYTYTIAIPLFFSVKRISKVFYLKPGESPAKYAKKYNIISIIFGWWGFFNTYATIVSNKEGVDLTDDIYDNLTEHDFEESQVVIEKISSVFMHLTKTQHKDLLKRLKKYDKGSLGFFSNPIIGYYINTEDPFYIIGLSEKDRMQKELVKKAFYKVFYKHTQLEFVDIDDHSSEVSEMLKKQGQELMIK